MASVSNNKQKRVVWKFFKVSDDNQCKANISTVFNLSDLRNVIVLFIVKTLTQ